MNLKFLVAIFMLIGACQGLTTENVVWISPNLVEIDGQKMILEGVSCSGLSEGMKEFITMFWQCMTDDEMIEYEIVGEQDKISVITIELDDININKKIMEEILFYQ